MTSPVAAAVVAALVLAASCDDTSVTPSLTGTLPSLAVCGNAVRDEGEACDPYAPKATWSCPDRACSVTCACTDAPSTGGSGGDGGDGGSGGDGGVGAGLPIGGSGVIDCDPPSGSEGPLALTPIVSGFDRPVLGIAPPGEANRLYVIEQPGRILLYEDGGATVFLDVTSRVVCCGERGLLGLAFHPDYATNGRFFIHYSDEATDGDTRVVEYARDPTNPDVALPDPVGQPLLAIEQPAGNHNGGAIEVSPMDGHLYVALGDGGGANDTFGNGQNLTTRLGKILRLDIEQTPAAPAGNYPGGDAYIWDMGLRNPWRTSFDRCTGDYYIGDVGQGTLEEVDVEPAGIGHRNYGWTIMEGSGCHIPATGCDMTGLTLPVAEYMQADECSVTGGYVYRGSSIPWLRGTYFYGDFCSGRIWSFAWNGSAATNLVDRSSDLESLGELRISSWGQDASGEIYAFDYATGTLYRVEAE